MAVVKPTQLQTRCFVKAQAFIPNDFLTFTSMQTNPFLFTADHFICQRTGGGQLALLVSLQGAAKESCSLLAQPFSTIQNHWTCADTKSRVIPVSFFSQDMEAGEDDLLSNTPCLVPHYFIVNLLSNTKKCHAANHSIRFSVGHDNNNYS